MITARPMRSRPLVRRMLLCLAFAFVFGASPAIRPQAAKPAAGSAGKNPLQDALELLRKGLSDPALKDTGIDVDSIVIGVDKRNLVYIPSEFHAKFHTNTTVRWVSWNGPFTLATLGISPFERVRIHSIPSAFYPGMHIAIATVQETAARGTYHYAIGLYSNGEVYLDPNCPPIIIESPPPPPPEPKK